MICDGHIASENNTYVAQYNVEPVKYADRYEGIGLGDLEISISSCCLLKGFWNDERVVLYL